MRSSVAFVSNCSSETPLICETAAAERSRALQFDSDQFSSVQTYPNELVVGTHAAGAFDGASASDALHEHSADARCATQFVHYGVHSERMRVSSSQLLRHSMSER